MAGTGLIRQNLWLRWCSCGATGGRCAKWPRFKHLPFYWGKYWRTFTLSSDPAPLFQRLTQSSPPLLVLCISGFASVNRQYSYSRYWPGTSLQLRLTRGVISSARDIDISPHEPPLQASSSPIPRTQTELDCIVITCRFSKHTDNLTSQNNPVNGSTLTKNYS